MAAIRIRAAIGSDISSHLETIFLEGLQANPRLIVELGVRGGQSTFVLERVARRCDATLVSADIDDCSEAIHYDKWCFVQEDDVAFGRRFGSWCSQHNLPRRIDLLFIDTSHTYEHTVAEIDAWFPHLGDGAVVMFHDTNLRKWYRRRDWTIGTGWDGHRGVMRAIEGFLGRALDERRSFRQEISGWHIKHDPICNGFTVLRRGPEAKDG